MIPKYLTMNIQTWGLGEYFHSLRDQVCSCCGSAVLEDITDKSLEQYIYINENRDQLEYVSTKGISVSNNLSQVKLGAGERIDSFILPKGDALHVKSMVEYIHTPATRSTYDPYIDWESDSNTAVYFPTFNKMLSQTDAWLKEYGIYPDDPSYSKFINKFGIFLDEVYQKKYRFLFFIIAYHQMLQWEEQVEKYNLNRHLIGSCRDIYHLGYPKSYDNPRLNWFFLDMEKE